MRILNFILHLAIVSILFAASSYGQGTLFNVQKFCEVGGQTVTTQGLNSTTKVQRSFPNCSVTVYLTGTTTKASIYSDNLTIPTPLANPFTANNDGSFSVYVAPSACYDVVTSGGNTGQQFPTPFTYANVCGGSGGGGGGGTVAGTVNSIAKFTGTTTVGDSSGIDTGSAPTQWPLGVNAVGNAGYVQKTAGSGGVVANELVQYSGATVIVAPAGTSKAKGIADSGVASGASVPVAVWGSHPCIFDNQTAANDYFAPSATNDGQCSDVGPTKPANVEIMGTVTTVNTGVGTLADVDLFTGDTIAPGSSGGSGTVTECASIGCNAYYAAAGTTVSGDTSMLDDGSGNGSAKSWTFTDTSHAMFEYFTQGPAPLAPPAHSAMLQAPTSIATSYTWQFPISITGSGSVGGCLSIASVASAVGSIDVVPCSGGGGSGTVTSVATGTGLTGGPITTAGTVLLADTAVTPGAYTNANITVDQQGRLTSAANGSAGGTGTVTSVGLALPAIFTVSGSPVTTSGSLSATLNAPGADYLPTSTAASTVSWEQINAGSSCGDGSHAIGYDISTHKFTCQTITTGGTGTVTSTGFSVNGGSSSGVFAVTGSPVTSSGTLNVNLSGTSGGVPYFSSSSVLSSSALLTANNPVIGGGAGTAPSSGARSGNTTTFGTTSGTLTSGHTASFDSSGNIVDGGSGIGASTQYIYLPNCSPTGTTTNKLVKWGTNTVNAGCVTITSTGDGTAGIGVQFIGICVSGCGTTGNAKVAIGGQASCVFDASTAAVQGDSVKISATTAGDCTDLTTPPANENPDSHYIFGSVDTAAAAGSTTTVNLTPISPGYGNIGAESPGTPNMTFLGSSSYGGTFAQPMMLQQTNSSNVSGVDLSLWSQGTTGFRFGDPSNPGLFYAKMRQCGGGGTCGAASHDFLIDTRTTGFNDYDALRINGGYYSVPLAFGTDNGTFNFIMGKAEEQTLTLNGAATLGVNTTGTNPGERLILHLCQDGTGGRAVTWNSKMVGAGVMPAAASACMTQEFIYNDSGTAGIPAVAPALPVTVVATSQAAAITTTNIAKPQVDSTYRVTATLDCDSSSAAATVNVTIGWTDPSNTAQTQSLGTAVVCTTLGSASVGNLTTAFRVKANTNITYATSIVNTPTYDVVVALETLTSN